MATPAKSHIPDGFHSVSPYLIIKNAAKAIDYYKDVFGAEEISRMAIPDGRIGHAEIKIGNSMLMLGDEFPEQGFKSPTSFGGTPVSCMVYVKDCDAVLNKAAKSGGTITVPASDMFWGDRFGRFTDPFGHEWSVSTHLEDLTDEEIAKRHEAFENSHEDCGGCGHEH